MKLRFACPGCGMPARLTPPWPASWQCPACDHLIPDFAEPSAGAPQACAVCGNPELYKKKDFPHWLGLTILTVASAAFLLGHKFYHPWLAWGVLIGSAVFDGLLYLWVGDAAVCYRCGAHYHGLRAAALPPFDLGVAERYRQEKLRREQFRAEQGPAGGSGPVG